MKHAREDYNRIQDPANAIPEDEPVFLLRGQDPLAPKCLLLWATELRLAGGDPEMARMVENQAQEMLEWQGENPTHIPDLPR